MCAVVAGEDEPLMASAGNARVAKFLRGQSGVNGAVDFGLGPQGGQGGKTYQDHVTTRKSCSCPLPDCLGVPCKHMFRVNVQENTMEGREVMPAEVVSEHWHCKTPQERSRLTAELLCLPVQRAAANRNADARFTPSERYALMTANFRVLAQIASQTRVDRQPNHRCDADVGCCDVDVGSPLRCSPLRCSPLRCSPHSAQ